MECVVQGIVETQQQTICCADARDENLGSRPPPIRMWHGESFVVPWQMVCRYTAILRIIFEPYPFWHVEALEVLLQGLSGVSKERLRVHELCLKSGPNLGAVASEVRLLCDLGQPTPTWTVRHIGGAMRGVGAEQLAVLVRSMVESKISKNALRFFYSLGYKLDHELLKVGFAFHFHRGAPITVTVTSANKMLKLHATDEAVPVTPGIQLVEVTAPATAENYSEVAASISSFCEYLAPLLHLSKPGVSTGIVPTAAAAAASLMSNSGMTAL